MKIYELSKAPEKETESANDLFLISMKIKEKFKSFQKLPKKN